MSDPIPSSLDPVESLGRPDTLEIEQIQALLRPIAVSTRSIRRWARTGLRGIVLPSVTIAGRRRFPASSFFWWLSQVNKADLAAAEAIDSLPLSVASTSGAAASAGASGAAGAALQDTIARDTDSHGRPSRID